MLGFGMACSHAAGLWRDPSVWSEFLNRNPAPIFEQYATAREQRDNPQLAQQHYGRIHAAFGELRTRLAAYKPDVLIMIGDDQGDMYTAANNPAISVYTGDEPMWGRSPLDWDKEPTERRKVVINNHPALSRLLLEGLIERGFDVSNSATFVPRGKPDIGVSHMAARIVPELDPSGALPVICVFINEYYPPLPTGERCGQLGRAIADVFRDRPERVAVCASGGLSHFPNPRNHNRGAIDIPLDRWVLERLERNDVTALEKLFAFDSDTLRAGTGEIRAWISAAAAMARPATVIDYIPVHATMTGCAFAYWTEAP